jgi:hypothetical protein
VTEPWCLPPEADASFVWPMEDVRDVSTRPSDPRRPQVGLDEPSRHRRADTREPRPRVPSHPAPPGAVPGPAAADPDAPAPLVPGHPKREDHESARGGVANLFLTCEPRRGWRHVMGRDHRTRIDVAHGVQELVDVPDPDAAGLVRVRDHLHPHTPASRYEAFAPAEAKRLADKREIPYTPKHGRWLHLAEIELSALATPGRDRRLPDRATLAHEVAAWQAARNAAPTPIDGRVTPADARIKLKHLYPSFQD